MRKKTTLPWTSLEILELIQRGLDRLGVSAKLLFCDADMLVRSSRHEHKMVPTVDYEAKKSSKTIT